MTATEHKFQAQVSEVLNLVINSLYSNKEIFLRELLSNASDALDKQRFQALTDSSEDADPLRIRIIPDVEAGTLTIEDNGIGMDEADLKQNLGTVAHSGSRELLEQLKAKADQTDDKELNLIGQFGVGFYSAYLVADQVSVVTRKAGSEQAFHWKSDAKESFTIEPAERDFRGTSVILHLKEEQKAELSEWKLRELVKRYSDYIGHPIELRVTKTTGEGEEQKTEVEFERVNQASALWQRPAKDITDEQYEEFYKHLTHDWEPAIARRHFKVEGTQLFTGLLFLPKRPPFDMFSPDQQHGVRLHVKRVFIMDDCEELLPRWLRFVRGVVDSEDLPLNVSRELLQDSRVVQVIRKQVIKHCLEMLGELAKDDEKYGEVWKNYGAVLKEGLHFDPQTKDKLADLLRYQTSKEDGLRSLDQYVEDMPDEQPAIYYAIGPTLKTVSASPHLEQLKERGYEVLYMVDAVDQWAVSTLDKYKDKPLVSAMDANLKVDAGEDKEGEDDSEKTQDASLEPLLERFKSVLSDHISEVRRSDRLASSPVCLVVPEGGLQPHIERMIRMQQGGDMPATKRIMEVNGDHPLITSLRTKHTEDEASDMVTEYIELLYDQALLAEGSPIDDPARTAQRLTALMQQSVGG